MMTSKSRCTVYNAHNQIMRANEQESSSNGWMFFWKVHASSSSSSFTALLELVTLLAAPAPGSMLGFHWSSRGGDALREPVRPLLDHRLLMSSFLVCRSLALSFYAIWVDLSISSFAILKVVQFYFLMKVFLLLLLAMIRLRPSRFYKFATASSLHHSLHGL